MATTNPTTALRILIVEDEALIAEEIQDRLIRLGFESLGIADSADKAIKAVEQAHPDLMLMDIQLKGPTDGVEAAVHIRRHFKVPVVFLTAHSDQATLARAKEAAPFGYLLKPFQARDLLVALEMAVHMHQLEERIRERMAELERTVLQLQQALDEVKTLRGLLPLCAWCRNIRDGAGDWHSLEEYLNLHTEAQVTHGICTACQAKIASEIESEQS